MGRAQLVCTVLFWSTTLPSLAQNLIPNPSFEEQNDCPEYLGSVRGFGPQRPEGSLKSWVANPSETTPDYYHTCGKARFKVPKNLCGNLPAKDGQAYVGMIFRIGATYAHSMEDLFYREHITTKLRQPLEEGKAYEFRFHIAQSEYSNFACGNIAAFFSEEPLAIKSNASYSPQLVWPKLLVCQNAWVEMVDTLIAKGGERFITLGNFDSFAQRKMKRLFQNPKFRKKFSYHRAYYFLDKLSLREVPLPTRPALLPVAQAPPIDDPFFGIIDWEQPIILKRVYFEFDQDQLLPESFPTLNELSRLLQSHADVQVDVIGHTDSIGNQEDNVDLSQRRAQRVKNYLADQGIDPKRIFSQGKGESQPLEDNGSEEGRQTNRRVEFVLHAKPD